jgi:hypothetical protein
MLFFLVVLVMPVVIATFPQLTRWLLYFLWRTERRQRGSARRRHRIYAFKS